MHMIKMFRVNPNRPDDLLPFYGYHDDNKQAIAKVGQKKRWDNFGKGSRKNDGKETWQQYEVGRSNDPVDVYAKHKGVSGMHTPDPSFSLYSISDIIHNVLNTFSVDGNRNLVVNNRLIENVPDDIFPILFYNLDRDIRRRTDNEVGLQDIYNLSVNRDTAETGRLVIPSNYKSFDLRSVFRDALKEAKSDMMDDAEETGDFSNIRNNIILPHSKDYYYTNGRNAPDYYNLLQLINDMGTGNDISELKAMPYLVDVNDSVFTRNDRYKKELEPQIDNSFEMVARSMTPKKDVSMDDVHNALAHVNRNYRNKHNTTDDINEAAKESLGTLFDIDPIEVSDERYKDILNDMSDDYFSDWLKFLNRRH